MSPIVVCKKCGTQNPLGKLFCNHCGEKLEVNEKSVKQAMAQAKRGGGGLTARLIRTAIFLVLLAGLAGLVIPTSAPGTPGTQEDANQLRRKLSSLRTAAVSAQMQEERILEAEVNGYFAAVLANQPPPPGGLAVRLTEARAALDGDDVRIWLKGTLGPVSLSYDLVGKAGIEPGRGFQFSPQRARIGHLPAVGLMKGRVAGQVAAFFQGMAQERVLLSRLTKWEPQEQAVVVAVGGRP